MCCGHRCEDGSGYWWLHWIHNPTISWATSARLSRPKAFGLNDNWSYITHFLDTYTHNHSWKSVEQAGQRPERFHPGSVNAILTSIRTLPYIERSPLGGVAGKGCKDIRRYLRKSKKPIKTAAEFEDFLFSSSRPGSLIFVELLRQLSRKLIGLVLRSLIQIDGSCFYKKCGGERFLRKKMKTRRGGRRTGSTFWNGAVNRGRQEPIVNRS